MNCGSNWLLFLASHHIIRDYLEVLVREGVHIQTPAFWTLFTCKFLQAAHVCLHSCWLLDGKRLVLILIMQLRSICHALLCNTRWAWLIEEKRNPPASPCPDFQFTDITILIRGVILPPGWGGGVGEGGGPRGQMCMYVCVCEKVRITQG